MKRDPEDQDPTQAEVPLPAAEGWRASLLLDNGEIGMWTVKSFPVFKQYACPEVVGLDDKGRCHVMVSYSGKWTPVSVIHDGKWLGGLAYGDVDPRIEGEELYTGGQNGNLYQVVPYREGVLDQRRIAHLPGLEIHTIVAGDLHPGLDGQELAVFTRPGNLYLVTPSGPGTGFDLEHVETLAGRVRDALILPVSPAPGPEIATVSSAGDLQILRFTNEGPQWSTVAREPMGMGRLAARRWKGSTVLYSSLDDGRILRHERAAGGGWQSETIYLGPQGPRGIAAGRFHEDPDVETIAIFGYGAKVQLLSRRAGGAFEVETIFVDRDKGHWLCAAELDGRNSTDELVACGYGARMVLLWRPPGYGRPGLATDEE